MESPRGGQSPVYASVRQRLHCIRAVRCPSHAHMIFNSVMCRRTCVHRVGELFRRFAGLDRTTCGSQHRWQQHPCHATGTCTCSAWLGCASALRLNSPSKTVFSPHAHCNLVPTSSYCLSQPLTIQAGCHDASSFSHESNLSSILCVLLTPLHEENFCAALEHFGHNLPRGALHHVAGRALHRFSYLLAAIVLKV